MSKSAGLLLYRRARGGELELLLVHPGGPFFARKDAGAWTIPKGLVDAGESELDAARRELAEETSLVLDENAELLDLGEVRQRGSKVVHAWAVEADCDPRDVRSNTFELEWPPRSGRRLRFPEIDRAAWFGVEEARHRVDTAQVAFVERLERLLRSPKGGGASPKRP